MPKYLVKCKECGRASELKMSMSDYSRAKEMGWLSVPLECECLDPEVETVPQPFSFKGSFK